MTYPLINKLLYIYTMGCFSSIKVMYREYVPTEKYLGKKISEIEASSFKKIAVG